ncbi:PREDICTED: BTB/POZ domain-containing protein 6-like [Acropora digitifera]|uniref:BTB/POZ domain-containing protein 6-like n=1 Tax=Acropora digitifera TaxID=70779 RepID=UPI00077ABDE9|nr:PREDICTED: BTB/POZ domain-containing protein 6-like [Acropora digitifera]
MATLQENWQTKCTSISQRTNYIFNTELLSDVKFIVPVSNGESESKVIPAHKLVLAIGSPVFYAMFYGQMSDTRDSIELPDCEYEGVLELFRFIYSDEVKLTGSNVMHVLYLAKKYLVPSLAEKCAEFLRKNLDGSNVFAILPHAQKFEDKDLEDRCWKVIEMRTDEALTSDGFVVAERSLVQSVVKREGLHVKELELFKAVNRWAEKEMEKQGIVSDGKAKRRIVGEEILKEIRFPLISLKEFASFVIDTNILNVQEVGDMIKHYCQVLTSPLPYLQSPRISVVKGVYRFKRVLEVVSSPPCVRSSLILSVDKAIHLHGVGHFGHSKRECTVSMEIKEKRSNSILVKKSGTYSSETPLHYSYCCFDVLFDTSVILEPGMKYEISSTISGPSSVGRTIGSKLGPPTYSWSGVDGQKLVNFEGVHFTFSASDFSNSETIVQCDQFPFFLVTHSG